MNTAINLVNICDSLSASGVTPKYTKLKSTVSRKRKSTLKKTASSGKNALGTHDTQKGSYVGAGDIAIGAGRMGTFNPVNSLGRQYTGDKAKIASIYQKQVAVDRKAAALDRIAG
tara:strand:- start:422 stop:766 length:345 start_codon:yes stop_codon:yes gene_type:complete